MKITALWHTSPSDSALITDTIKKPNTNEIQIKSLYSLISSGTERLVATGKIPESLHQSMRVPGMKGQFNFPIKYGYSLVGEVLSKGSLEGEIIHLLYPHQDKLVAKIPAVSIIPREIPPKRAALASNLETALNAIWDSGVTIGDKVLVCGFGMIGALVARLLSFLPAVEIMVLEKNEYRMAMAQKMGFKIHQNNQQVFDLSFHTSSSSEGLQNCIASVGMEGKIIELSWYGTKAVSVHLGTDFHFQRKSIISSQVAHIPFSKAARWNYQRRKSTVLALLKNPIFDEHITQEIPFSDSPSFFDDLRDGRILSQGLGWVIKY